MISKAIGEQAVAYDNLIAKRKLLEAQKATEGEKPQFSETGAITAALGQPYSKELTQAGENVKRLGKEIENIDSSILEISERRLELQQKIGAGRDQEIAAYESELQTKQKIADVDESVKNIIGLTDKQTEDFRAKAKGAILAEGEHKKKLIELSRIQELSQTNLNEISAVTGIEYADQLNLQREKIAAQDIAVKAAEQELGAHNMITSILRMQKHELELHTREMEHQHASQLIAAKDAVSVMESEIAGNKTLASIEANRAQHAQAIRDALRAGNTELANQLAKQQALSDLEAKVKQFQETPKEKADGRKAQDAHDHAVRTVEKREKDVSDRANAFRKPDQEALNRVEAKIGTGKFDERDIKRKKQLEARIGRSDNEILGRTDSNRHISKSAAEAAKANAARHALPNVNAAKQQLQDIKANTIIVQQIKNS